MGRPAIVDDVLDRLLTRLASGAWEGGSGLPSVRRLASEFGVSRRTIQAAERKAASLGLLDIRQRQPVTIRADASAHARELLEQRHGRRPRIAILLAEPHFPVTRNVFYAALVTNMVHEAARHEMEATPVDWPVREQMALAAALPGQGFDAAVLVGFDADYIASLFALHQRGFPVMVFNHHVPGLDLPTVTIDLYSASQVIVDRLFRFGHRNMCMVIHPDSHAEIRAGLKRDRAKAAGWADRLHEHGLLEECSMPVYMPWEHSQIGIYNSTFRLILRSPRRPTAIVFAHSPWAKVFLTDPEFGRLRVPEEISLATFESVKHIPAAPRRPTITSIEIDHARTAQCIIETLQKMLRGDPRPPVIRVALKMHLTDSVGPPPRSNTTQKAEPAGGGDTRAPRTDIPQRTE